MLKSTYVQQCAHNTAERRAIRVEFKQKNSANRKRYLNQRMRYLMKEREWLLSIKKEFLLSPKDCFVLE